jgi:hypothetical protein
MDSAIGSIASASRAVGLEVLKASSALILHATSG